MLLYMITGILEHDSEFLDIFYIIVYIFFSSTLLYLASSSFCLKYSLKSLS